MHRERRAMTLLEVMLALALAGLALLSARMLLAEIERAGSTLGRTARVNDELSNATRTLYALVRRADVRPDSAQRFVGDSLNARFRSLCERPGGWLERCGVTVLLQTSIDSSALVGQLPGEAPLVLARWPGVGALRYLDVVGGRDQWVSQWGRSITPPIAMAVVLPSDTIILPIAGR